MSLMLALLAVVWVSIRWMTVALARREDHDLLFEEEALPAVQGLGLHRDGEMPIGEPETRNQKRETRKRS
jgi:hypothetical protein